MSGLREEQTAYGTDFDPRTLIGTLHSIGPDGPTYEVLEIVDGKMARVCILESERAVNYEIVEILRDPGPDAAWKTKR